MTEQMIKEKIQQRRLQILVHSFIYYELNDSIISDSKWSEWAMELVKLQQDHPEIAEKVIYHWAFKDFDGSSGYNLPYRTTNISNKAFRIMYLHGKYEYK